MPAERPALIERPRESLGLRMADALVPGVLVAAAVYLMVHQFLDRPWGSPISYGLGGAVGVAVWAWRLYHSMESAADDEDGDAQRLDEKWRFHTHRDEPVDRGRKAGG
ncbi:MAG: hypothetical protein ACHQU1_12915 [Gemmatimonadales bacterium]